MLASVLVGLVAALHVYFMILEMFLWSKPFGLKTLGMTAEHAKLTQVMASNQGLYNGFLSAGLIWGYFKADCRIEIQMFFLICIVIAGIFGAATASKKILWVQALPAAIAAGVLYFSN